jgi:ABC-2 type transport system ATP-binding protein
VRWWDDNGSHEEVTESPTRLVSQLAERFGGEVPELQVIRPSLEDVYLGLIGDTEPTHEDALEGALR